MPFPEQRELIRDLVVNDHALMRDEPLRLAIYYASRLVPNEECLLEVADNFGHNEVGEDREFFQIQFGGTPRFPLPSDDRMRLVLTNPAEFRHAAAEGWDQIEDVRNAIAEDRFTLLYPESQEAQPLDQGTQELLGLVRPSLAAA